jgi:Na+/melibiose symporter-like transporter
MNNLPRYTGIKMTEAVCVFHVFHLKSMLKMFTKKVFFSCFPLLLCILCILLFIGPENHLDVTVPLAVICSRIRTIRK